MSYQKATNDPYPPPGYGTVYPPPPPGYPSAPPSYDGYPSPQPSPPVGYPPPGYPGHPPPPPPPNQGYQGYFNGGGGYSYPYPPPQQPQYQQYHHCDHHYYDDQSSAWPHFVAVVCWRNASKLLEWRYAMVHLGFGDSLSLYLGGSYKVLLIYLWVYTWLSNCKTFVLFPGIC
ncbi:hypothetical protein RJ641_007169 [Dillenia turbinata]|uniref:Uncharacterized protein n=1 Tax=Dillenia turbinata TaxID=194707 RepID=A0AAN8ZCG7_9MAGN